MDAEKSSASPEDQVQEVVRMGFQSNFLFQNISNVFSAPRGVLDVRTSSPSKSQGKAHQITPDTGLDLSLSTTRASEPGRGLCHRQGSGCVQGEDLLACPGAGHRPLQDLTDAVPAKKTSRFEKDITKRDHHPMVEQAESRI